MRSTRSTLVLVVLVSFLLAGCGILSPQPTESAPTSSPGEEWVARQARYNLKTVDISDTDLECEPAADWAREWVTTHFTQSLDASRPALPKSDFAMVEVGAGERPDQTWWVVAVVSYESKSRRDLTFVTDSDQWVNVGAFRPGGAGATDWTAMLSWTDERILRGVQAQKLALSCLPDALSS